MKRILCGLVVLVILWVAYWASPFLSLRAIAANLQSRNTRALLTEVDFDRLRGSLSSQVMKAYLRISGRANRLGPFGAALATAVGTPLADPLVAQFLSPEHLQELLTGRTISTEFGEISLGSGRFPGLFMDTAFKAWVGTDYWFDRFSIGLPVEAPHAEQYRLNMQIQQWKWKVVGLDLPQGLLNQLAQELAKRFP